MHERIRDKILAGWGRLVASHPLATLAVCLPIAAASVVLTATGLEFESDRSRLIDPEQSWNLQYGRYKETFPQSNDLIVVLEGDPDDTAVNELARRVSQNLAGDGRVRAADAGFDAAEAGPRFFTFAGREKFDRTLGELTTGRRIADADNANALLAVLLAALTQDQSDPASLDRLDEFIEPYLDAARNRTSSFDFLDPKRPNWQPLASNNGEGPLRFVRVQLANGGNGLNTIGSTLTWLRGFVDETVKASERPGTAWGVTGIRAIEADETTQAIRDSTIASLLAITLITLVMFVAFRGLRVPLLAAGALFVGMAWSFGWLMITVGHLQILSVVFCVILLGLGIDFALLFVSRLELIKDEHQDLASATSRVYQRMGPGMVTGAVTTSAAFAAIALTKFKGMAEMGTIAAGGILLCLIAVLSVFPALLALTGRWKQIIRHRPGGETAPFARGRLNFVDDHPRPTLIVVSLTVAVLLVVAVGTVRYDPNVLNLQSKGVESVDWEKRVVDEDARSAWSAVVLAKPENAETLVGKLRRASAVSDVGGMGILYPPDLAERQEAIARIRDGSFNAPPAKPGMAQLLRQLVSVQTGIRIRAASLPEEIRTRLNATSDHITAALQAARNLDRKTRAAAWERLNQNFLAVRDRLAGWLDEALAPGDPVPEDLPALLRDQWTGQKDRSWLLLVHPKAGDQSILAPERLEPFVKSIEVALAGPGDPGSSIASGTSVQVIGPPVQIYRSSLLIQREFLKAAILAVAAIVILLFLDFRSLADALCAMAPVSIGFVGAFGLMGLAGVPLNFANIIVLPIIFGIGVNAGVHVVHRWRLEPSGRPKGLSGGTGRGITLTMLTTMIGFGCLLIAQHRGIRSLGFVMIIGLGVTLLACYIALPAVLRLRTSVADAVGGSAPQETVTQASQTPAPQTVGAGAAD